MSPRKQSMEAGPDSRVSPMAVEEEPQEEASAPEDEVEVFAELEDLSGETDEELRETDAGAEVEDHLLAVQEETRPVPLTPLQRYLAEIRRFKPLSAEEEYELAVRYREEGDQQAAWRLVTANLSLVVKIARLYARVYHNVIDLIQEGNLGLIEAVKRFDPYKGNRLPTYASWWIKAYIIKFLLDNFRIVRVGTTNERRRLLFNLRREKERLRLQGIEPTHQLLAERLNVSEEDVRAVESNIESGDLRLDAYVDEDEKLRFVDTLRTTEEQIEDRLARGELQELFNRKLEEFARGLGERERVILKERLIAQEPKTLQEIADRFGVTREAIRLNEKALIKKIKKYMERELKGITQVEIALLT
ncbi:MAG TPA: RNA polymerase factor sigma-32 [Acidobacteriota bacterium]|nr:RNA polymerase factor sigma-32 [Acidobacteriota bacterium]HRR25518.1 RNA polymerase factor sigma-32 [Acidobacteriota bacterium]